MRKTYFHAPYKKGHIVEGEIVDAGFCQGQILRRLNDRVRVQLFSYMTGYKTDIVTAPAAWVDDWILYPTLDAWHAGSERLMVRFPIKTKREPFAPVRDDVFAALMPGAKRAAAASEFVLADGDVS